jgi:hypothetical protein
MARAWKLPWAGGCRCGQVRLKVTQAPLMSMACHCTGCQSMSSSAYSLTLIIPEAGFDVTQGEPVLGGLKGEQAGHYFCGSCMTWMFTRAKGHPFVNLRPSMLDDHAWFVPYMESYTCEALGWAKTPAVKRYETFPETVDFPALMAEFAEHGARPN